MDDLTPDEARAVYRVIAGGILLVAALLLIVIYGATLADLAKAGLASLLAYLIAARLGLLS